MLKTIKCFLSAAVAVFLLTFLQMTLCQANDIHSFHINVLLGDINSPPQIANILVTGNSGDISINFDLIDNDADLCSVVLEYTSDNDTPLWTTATISGDISDLVPGEGLSLIWNSGTDLPQANGENYWIRISASDSSATGDWEEYGPVAVINTYSIASIAFDQVYSPQINNNGLIVWSGDFIDGDITKATDIYLRDEAGTATLTDYIYYAMSPKINESGAVIWTARDGYDGIPATGNDYEIYRFDGTSTAQLTDNAQDDLTPEINNLGHSVWTGYNGVYKQIFFNDGSSTLQITSSTDDKLNPRLNNDDSIVWTGWDGIDWEIYLYKDNVITQITDNMLDDNDARINDLGQIVWSGYDGHDMEIFLYQNSITTQITDNNYDDLYPQINSHGTIAWLAKDGFDSDLYLYDGISTTQVTTQTDNDSAPQLNNNTDMVWSGGSGSESEIYVYHNNTITQLTHDAYIDVDPTLNDSRFVVWRRWNGTYWEIMLAIPASAPEVRLISIEQVSDLINLVWFVNPPSTNFKILWTNDLPGSMTWDTIDGPALDDIIDHEDGIKSWTDRGTDPDMSAQSPADVDHRLYKISIEE